MTRPTLRVDGINLWPAVCLDLKIPAKLTRSRQ